VDNLPRPVDRGRLPLQPGPGEQLPAGRGPAAARARGLLHGLLAARRAALALALAHLALALAAAASRRPAAAEAHRRLFALFVAAHTAAPRAHTAAGVLAVRRAPALYGHLVFLPAGHACIAGCLLVFSLCALASSSLLP
jgi:hypothetical protein